MLHTMARELFQLKHAVDTWAHPNLPYDGTPTAWGQGMEDAVCVLLEADADADARDASGWTALHHAAAAGHPLVVEARPRTHPRAARAPLAVPRV
jgi:hypothetical protein